MQWQFRFWRKSGWPGTRFMRVLWNTSELRFVVEDGTGMGSPLE